MPTVGVKRTELMAALGREYSDVEFDELCFQFGLELDEITSEQEMIAKEQGEDKAVGADTSVIYKIDVPANRYDLLCVEGLSRGLKIFLKQMEPPAYKLTNPSHLQQLIIESETAGIRPYAVAAVLRGITFTPERYASFIDLQDKLHQNLCRRRTLVAIGTHDLDTITGPFYYRAQPYTNIQFKPLNKTEELTAEQMMSLFSGDSHLKQYLPIIRDSPVYPIIYDSNNVVLSMPPIINGDHSKITLKTRDVFIEMTATDQHKASICLDILVAMFSEYCETPFTIEPVEVISPDGSKSIYPKLPYRTERVSPGLLNSRVGISEEASTIAESLSKMCLPSHYDPVPNEITVSVPPTRPDVIHVADIVEDVAIAYGYDNIVKCMPDTATIGSQQPVNKLTDLLRQEIAHAGFAECLSFILCSRDDVSSSLRLPPASVPAVHITKPKAHEFQVARTTLLPGILKTVASNKNQPLPIKLFEIQDVVIKDSQSDVGACNERRICALNYNKLAGFEIVHGLLDRIMQLLLVQPTQYKIQPAQHPSYFPSRCAEVIVQGQVIGTLGVLHPEVLSNFELNLPTAALEISIEPFL